MRCFILMGVSGCGKTNVGEALAQRSALTFIDGDALHPKANIEKMSRGQPLDDNDRKPWLIEVGQRLSTADGPIVIGCSALKRSYRDIIRAQLNGRVHFLHLDAPKKVLAERVANRPGHFMPASLLDSQFAALVPLGQDEDGCTVDVTMPMKSVVLQCERYMGAAIADRPAPTL